jgi:hypothetical protein
MSQVIAPKSIVRASGGRRESAHGGLFQTLVGILPLVGSTSDAKSFHAYDVVVSSRNPLLAALVLFRAAKAGASAAIMMSEDSDPWPYDLADTDELATLIASAVGLPGEAHPTGGSSTSWLLERMLAAVPRSYPIVEGTLAPASRHPDDEIALYMTGKTISSFERLSPLKLTSPEQACMQDIFLRFMEGRPLASIGSRGRTVVFSRQIVLTGRPEVFGRSNLSDGLLDWGNPRIAALGTARWVVSDHREAAELMMEDVLLAGRWTLPS